MQAVTTINSAKLYCIIIKITTVVIVILCLIINQNNSDFFLLNPQNIGISITKKKKKIQMFNFDWN